MARPIKTGLDYFPHDVDASNDEKIEAMETMFGAQGYTFYFKLAERIYRAGGELAVADDVTRDTLAKKCLCARPEWDSMLATAFQVGLFDKPAFEERKVLTSSGIKKRCRDVFAERRRKAKWKKGKDLKKEVRDVQNTGKTSEGAGLSFHESKGKEIKGKERKEKESKALDSAASAARPRNELWDTIVQVFGFTTPHPDRERARIGKVVSDLKAKGATPDEIRHRHQVARAAWKGGPGFGPEALAKHWDSLGRGGVSGAPSRSELEKTMQQALLDGQEDAP